jgi:predicted dehydrogenase
VPEATVVAIAARDPARAVRFAGRHGVARVHGSYDALLADPEIDAVYNPLPNSLHALWTIRALEAGKHVLCEKPLAANVAEAEAMAAAAQRTGRVLVEAFHYRYHPLFRRIREIMDSGEIGEVRHLEAHLCIPLLLPGDIRYRADLAGGALMDTGCYTVHMLRHLAGAEPTVVGARGRWTRGGVDRCMEAHLRFADGRSGRLTCSLFSSTLLRAAARVEGSTGRIDVVNPIAPQLFHRLRVRTRAGVRREHVAGGTSYECQLRAFVATVRDGTPVPTGPTDSIANMRVIEAIYAAAGRPSRASAGQ